MTPVLDSAAMAERSREPTPHERLTAAALAHVRAGTTDLADDVLRVPLGYYTDPELFARERDDLLVTTPLPLVPSAASPRAATTSWSARWSGGRCWSAEAPTAWPGRS